MRYHFTWLLVFGVLGAVGSQSSPQNTAYKYVVTGRVVDERGHPVRNATVVLEAPGPSQQSDVHIEYHQTDSKGRFSIEEEASLPTLERVLYVATTVPDHTYAPISPPFPMATRSDPRFAGRRILVARDRETDSGDVAIQVRYGLVSVHLQYPKEATLFEATIEAGSLPDIQLATRTKQGDMVHRGAVSPGAFHKSESTIALALPEGEWQLEVASTIGDTNLTAVSPPLAVRESSLLKTTLRLAAVDSLTEPPDVIHTSDEGVARKELERLGFPLTGDAFVERARMGNSRVVLLLLDAGISPNTRSQNGETALTAAIREGHSETARTIIARGADVNLPDGDGVTPLMIAAFADVDMVQLLLNKSADVNAKSNNGTTALFMAAAGNGQVHTVQRLLSAGADVTVKNNDGDTALMIAGVTGDKKIIELLKSFGARE